MKRYFTIDEAEKILPDVENKLKILLGLRKTIQLMRSVKISYEEASQENYVQSMKIQKEYHRLLAEFYDNLIQLEEMGCLVKDMEVGLVDFYSVYKGREIFLCWRSGERGIGHWHEVSGGYVGRKPINMISLSFSKEKETLGKSAKSESSLRSQKPEGFYGEKDNKDIA